MKENFVLPSHKLFAGTQKSMMLFHRGKMKVVNKIFQVNNLLHCNQKWRSTIFKEGRMMRTS
jgi:hypothetical protein